MDHSLLTPQLLPFFFFFHCLLCVVPFHCHPCHLVVTRWLPRLSVAQPHMVETKAGAEEARKTTFSSQEVQQTSCYKSFAKAGAERTGFTGLACLQHESSFGLSMLLLQRIHRSLMEKEEGCCLWSYSVSVAVSSWVLSAWPSAQGYRLTWKLVRSTQRHSPPLNCWIRTQPAC